MIKLIVQKIHTLLDSGVDKLQAIYSFEKADSEGTPFATITPSANESAYQTTTENERVYAFDLRLFTERKGQTNEADSESAMRELVDDVLDVLDANWDLSGLGTRTGYTFLLMEAAPSVWGYVGRENEYRMAEINIRVHFSVDVNLI